MALVSKSVSPNVPRAVWLGPAEMLELAALVQAAVALDACDPRVEMARQVARVRARWQACWSQEWWTGNEYETEVS